MNLLPSISSIVKGFLESKLKVIIQKNTYRAIQDMFLQKMRDSELLLAKLKEKFLQIRADIQ